MVNTPRTVEACRRLGYEPEELVFKTELQIKQSFGDPNIAADVLALRFHAHEEARKTKVQKVMEERKRIIKESPNRLTR